MRLEWSHFALADRNEIFDYIEADSPRAAVTMDDRISACAALLIESPERGRPGRIEGAREMIVSRTPYLAAYRIAADAVRILRICTVRGNGPMRCRTEAPTRGNVAEAEVGR